MGEVVKFPKSVTDLQCCACGCGNPHLVLLVEDHQVYCPECNCIITTLTWMRNAEAV